jgi:hypothetical protein
MHWYWVGLERSSYVSRLSYEPPFAILNCHELEKKCALSEELPPWLAIPWTNGNWSTGPRAGREWPSSSNHSAPFQTDTLSAVEQSAKRMVVRLDKPEGQSGWFKSTSKRKLEFIDTDISEYLVGHVKYVTSAVGRLGIAHRPWNSSSISESIVWRFKYRVILSYFWRACSWENSNVVDSNRLDSQIKPGYETLLTHFSWTSRKQKCLESLGPLRLQLADTTFPLTPFYLVNHLDLLRTGCR